jgi:hypothetical protein
MAFNINTFKQAGLVYGGARPSLFEIILTVPPTVDTAFASQKFTFTCKAAELPESTISAIEVPYFGRKIKVAGERTFADWSVTVMNDEDFSVRALFETWSNAINRMVANVRDPAVAVENYKVDLEVVQYAKDGTKIRSYLLVGAFPTQVGAIALSWDSQNAIEKFAVSFEYDYWIPLTETSDKKAGGVNTYGAEAQLDGTLGPV